MTCHSTTSIGNIMSSSWLTIAPRKHRVQRYCLYVVQLNDSVSNYFTTKLDSPYCLIILNFRGIHSRESIFILNLNYNRKKQFEKCSKTFCHLLPCFPFSLIHQLYSLSQAAHTSQISFYNIIRQKQLANKESELIPHKNKSQGWTHLLGTRNI